MKHLQHNAAQFAAEGRVPQTQTHNAAEKAAAEME
jgi:hypothetical protein